jgi:2-hydroxychromene-2-carboxylate isomerase
MAMSLDFWFDYTCPYAYLGSTQARALAARMGVPLTYQPLLLGGVFREKGTAQRLSETLGPAKAAHNAEDLQRWAKRFGVTLRMPANHPIRSVEALRATLATNIDPNVIDAFYRAYWVDNTDLSSREVIAKIVQAHGHDSARVLEAIDTSAIKDDLRARTAKGVALGIFGVPAWIVDGKELYWGQDRMHFVEAHAPGPALDVYWDFSSPFAYLGASQVAALARRTNTRVTWRPLLLGGLFRSIGTADVPLATFSEAKQKHTMNDLHRWAAYWDVPFRFPSRFPIHTLKAMRVYLALGEEHRASYRAAVFRACWAEDRDITQDDVLASCIGDEAIACDALARSNSDDVKAELRRCTEEAAAKGVFGVPTFIVTPRGGEPALFWGQDRLELVEEALTKKL